MNVLIISDLTGGLGGVYTYLQQIQFFLSNENSIHILLDLTTKKVFQKTMFLILLALYHYPINFILKR